MKIDTATNLFLRKAENKMIFCLLMMQNVLRQESEAAAKTETEFLFFLVNFNFLLCIRQLFANILSNLTFFSYDEKQ